MYDINFEFDQPGEGVTIKTIRVHLRPTFRPKFISCKKIFVELCVFVASFPPLANHTSGFE